MTVTLESLSDSRNTLARLCLLAVRAADKTWKGVDPRRVRDSWNRTNVDFITLFAALQTRAASDAMDSSTLMLAEQDDYVRPDGIANPMAFGTGFAPSGIDLESYFSIPVTRTLQAIKSGVGESDAMQIGRATLRQMSTQALEDTSVSAMGVSITQRAGVGYVRVESPDCCPRCAILAGKYFRHSQNFLRHPKCHGTTIPCKGRDKAEKQGWITDPMDRFNRMSEAEQDRVFGHADAQAIRDGADIYQVVNAHRGMRPGRTRQHQYDHVRRHQSIRVEPHDPKIRIWPEATAQAHAGRHLQLQPPARADHRAAETRGIHPAGQMARAGAGASPQPMAS